MTAAEKKLNQKTSEAAKSTGNSGGDGGKKAKAQADEQKNLEREMAKLSQNSANNPTAQAALKEAAENMQKAAEHLEKAARAQASPSGSSSSLAQSALQAADLREKMAIRKLQKAGKAVNSSKGSEMQSSGGSLGPLGALAARQTSMLKEVNMASGTDASVGGGLSAKDRGKIEQSRNESYPTEYGDMVEQYMRNLSEKP